jgi:hypothetical protein
MVSKMDERKLAPIPRFASEAEEARWWFDHREELGQDLIVAGRRNGLRDSSAMRRARKLQEDTARSSAA